MERDTFSRFKGDRGATSTLVAAFYEEAGADAKDGSVSFEAFQQWAINNTSVLVFFTQLTSSIKSILQKRK
jgi:hypothetical protein